VCVTGTLTGTLAGTKVQFRERLLKTLSPLARGVARTGRAAAEGAGGFSSYGRGRVMGCVKHVSRIVFSLGILAMFSGAVSAAVIGKATVTADQAPVLSGKQVIATAKKGDTFDVTEAKGDWFGVAPSQGWIHKGNVRYEPGASASALSKKLTMEAVVGRWSAKSKDGTVITSVDFKSDGKCFVNVIYLGAGTPGVTTASYRIDEPTQSIKWGKEEGEARLQPDGALYVKFGGGAVQVDTVLDREKESPPLSDRPKQGPEAVDNAVVPASTATAPEAPRQIVPCDGVWTDGTGVVTFEVSKQGRVGKNLVLKPSVEQLQQQEVREEFMISDLGFKVVTPNGSVFTGTFVSPTKVQGDWKLRGPDLKPEPGKPVVPADGLWTEKTDYYVVKFEVVKQGQAVKNLLASISKWGKQEFRGEYPIIDGKFSVGRQEAGCVQSTFWSRTEATGYASVYASIFERFPGGTRSTKGIKGFGWTAYAKEQGVTATPPPDRPPSETKPPAPAGDAQ
jgi:hypothetical protein